MSPRQRPRHPGARTVMLGSAALARRRFAASASRVAPAKAAGMAAGRAIRRRTWRCHRTLPGSPRPPPRRLDTGSHRNVSPCGYCSDRDRDTPRQARIVPARRLARAGGRRSCRPGWPPGPRGGRCSIRNVSGAWFSHRHAGLFRGIGRIPPEEGGDHVSGRKERRAAAA